MKIGFCGAGGTGKGTLAKALSEKLNIKMISSSVQWVGNMLTNASNYAQIKDRKTFQIAAVMAQAQSERLFDNFIAERTVFDYLAYAKQFMDKDDYFDYQNLVDKLFYSNPYDVIFYLPIEFEPTDNSPWKERSDTRRITDNFLRTLLFDITFPCKVQKLSGSVQERLIQAITFYVKQHTEKEGK